MIGDRTPMIGDRTPMIGDRTPMIGDRTPAPDHTPGHWGSSDSNYDSWGSNQYDHRDNDYSTVTPSFDNTVSPYGQIGTPNVMVMSFSIFFSHSL